MRLLLDEMHSPTIADSLRSSGHDVVAINAGGELRGLPDEDVLIRAALDGQAVVTENVADFLPLSELWVAEGRSHAGIVLTNPRRFARSRSTYPGDLIAALNAFLLDPPVDGDSWIWWL